MFVRVRLTVSLSHVKMTPSTAGHAVIEIAPPRGGLHIDLDEVWRARELGLFFVWRAIKIRYKQTVIGAAWAVLQPVAGMLVFTLFLGHLAHLPADGLPYPIFYFTGLLPWTYFSSALESVTSSVVEQQHVVTKVYFPRLLLPLSATLPGLLDFAIGLVVMLPLFAIYHLVPGWSILLFPGFLLLAMATVLSLGLWLAALNSIYRDVHHIVPFVIQIWMFLSPVLYPASLVPSRWRWIYGLNPITGVIEGFRWSLTGHGQPPSLLLGISAAVVLIVLAGGLAFFHKMESVIADVV